MTAPTPSIAAATAQARIARERLRHTFGEVQARLKPSALAHDATEGLKAKGAEAVSDGVEVVRAHPAQVGGAAGLLGLFLLRKPIARLFRRRRHETSDAPTS